MELWLAALAILGAAAMSVPAMLLVRRPRARGVIFKDPIPAAAVYTVVGTAYTVIVAFVFFVAFESYSGAKADADEEATAILAMYHAALSFEPATRARLQGQVVCYAREVIADEWSAMRSGKTSPIVDARVRRMEEVVADVPLEGAKQHAAYDVAIIVVSGLVLVRFLDRPYEDKSGSIKPTAMASTLAQMESEHRRGNEQPLPPCS